jgi:hypothetical protein
MADILNKIGDLVNKDDKLLEVWARKNPKFEKKFEQSVMRVISDYGIGASENANAKGKVLGAGYEPYIMAFFIGLYSNRRLPLSTDTDDTKVLGQPIQYWGNLDSKKFRKAYSKLRTYIFVALVAKTEIDWIALDKGDIKVSSVAASLLETMEEYANYGFTVLEDKLKEDKGFFFSHRSFLDIFLQLTSKEESCDDNEDKPEDL